MRYKWGFKKDLPERKRGDSPKLCIRHLELMGQTLPGRGRSWDVFKDFIFELTMGWHPCIRATELHKELEALMLSYNIDWEREHRE